jgi:RecA/RadA recombinase
LDLLKESYNTPKLTTGNIELDSLLAGGVENSAFHLFYGDQESGVDHLIHQILIHSLLPVKKGGWDCAAVYLNCGNYKYERTILNVKLLTKMIRSHRLNVSEALNRIYAIPAYSEEQEEASAAKIPNLLDDDKTIKLVIIHNIAKLFTSSTWSHDKDVKTKISRLQGVVGRVKQVCYDRGVSIVASCRPCETYTWRPPQPEGGRYLRHLANIMVYLRKVGGKSPYITAFLLKHPKKPPKRTDIPSLMEVNDMGRLTIPFRVMLQEELTTLKRTFRDALRDSKRREAFDLLSKAWTAEQGAMSYAQVPTLLDTVFLTAAVDNRKNIDELIGQLNILRSEIEELKHSVEKYKAQVNVASIHEK